MYYPHTIHPQAEAMGLSCVVICKNAQLPSSLHFSQFLFTNVVNRFKIYRNIQP